MATTIEKRTVSLPTEHSAFIDGKIASGEYASASEVVGAGLRALQERDRMVETWLRRDVAESYDAYKAEPRRLRDEDDVYRRLRERHAERSSGRS